MTNERDDTKSNTSQRTLSLGAWLRAPLRVWVSRLLPYVVSAAVLGLLFRRYSVQAIYREMARGNTLPLLPIALCTFALSILFVSASDSLVLRGLMARERVPSYLAMTRGKAATVLLHIVHYALGQGAYATWMARKTGLGITRVSGILLYIVAAELCSVCVYASIVIAVGRPHVPASVPVFAALISAGIIGGILVLPSAKALLERFKIFEPWTHMNRARGVAQIFARLPQHTTTSVGTWLAARAFGLEIPFWVMLSYVPVLLIVSSLPINVAGFGAVQGAWLLLSPWAEAERILAFSFVWQLVSCVALIARGLPFVRSAMADIRQGSPFPPEDRAREDSPAYAEPLRNTEA